MNSSRSGGNRGNHDSPPPYLTPTKLYMVPPSCLVSQYVQVLLTYLLTAHSYQHAPLSQVSFAEQKTLTGQTLRWGRVPDIGWLPLGADVMMNPGPNL